MKTGKKTYVQYNQKKIEQKKGDGQQDIVNKNGPFCVQKLRNYVWRQGKIKGIHMSQRARKKGREFNMFTLVAEIGKQIQLFKSRAPKMPTASILKM